ncbi:glycosyltransferase family 2 protein [Labilibaculum antarcticum]|uniref:Glycosyltransferase 2-like domain-containing protein n=1 Tax=Labilibaculum antarcticum TaxID=1717717 RepID=A0A1Y1CQ90_9BACT|nr:glycosyltransferase family 2 protein [Labilibaculum antarcticum]BAX82629.1 hypothetical protein ALGA_4339 [Labilibaculum antarcticum]
MEHVMNSYPEISVIIPVYNAGRYLDRCIGSVLSQSFQSFELILINDFSSDNSLSICRSYCEKYDDIQLINLKKNKGVDNARFEGIRASLGKFLMFVDSDDWIAPKSIQILHDDIISTNADISSGALVRVLDKFGMIRTKPQNMYGQYVDIHIGRSELMKEYLVSYFGVNKLMVSMCGKLYRKSVVLQAKVAPSNFKMGEDLIFNLSIHPFLKKISIVKKEVYYYRFGGMTDGFNQFFFKDVLDQYILKKKYAMQYNVEAFIETAKIEIKNCFKTHIKMLIRCKHLNNAKEFITVSLEDYRFIECMDYYRNKSIFSDKFIVAVLSLDEEGILKICINEVRQERLKRKVKTIVSRLMN